MQRKFFFIVGTIVVFTAFLLLELRRGAEPTKGTAPAQTVTVAENIKARVQENFGKLPLYFVENRGQLDERVAYYAQGRDKAIYFTDQGLTFVLSRPSPQQPQVEPASLRYDAPSRESQTRYTLKLEFVNARADLHPVGREQTEAVFSYFKGTRDEWQAGLKSYAQVVYENVWPGIDLVYAGTVNRMKYSFIVRPGADPNQVRLAWRGATGLAVNQDGGLEVQTPGAGFTDEHPVSWQERDGERCKVTTDYSLDAPNDALEYGFRLAAYDRSRELVIDPVVLVYCGYIGSGSNDDGGGITVDSEGNAYVVGYTNASAAQGFPVTVGPDLNHKGSADVFVAKVKPDGTGLLYCGYIGGSGLDFGYGIAVDRAGNAHVTGFTTSSEAQGFPVTVGPDTTFNGGNGDAFVATVNAAGTSLIYCGYIGSSNIDDGRGIAMDRFGNAYVTGYTYALESQGFPLVVGPNLTFSGAVLHAFVAKVKADGTGLVYCGFIGGGLGTSIAVDELGNAYVTGLTSSSEAQGFPVTVGPDLTFNGGGQDAFVAKVKANGTGFHYSGYIGGSQFENAHGIAVDKLGNAYVTGVTGSTEAEGFPVTVGRDTTHNGENDAFVAKVNADGTGLVYCGYIGGSANDTSRGIAVDRFGNAFVTGETFSAKAAGFPITTGPDINADHPAIFEKKDAFVAIVTAAGTSLEYCRYIGGQLNDNGNSIAVDMASSIYLRGWTESSESEGFPVRVGPDVTHNGGGNAFVAKLSENQAPITKCHNVTVVAGANCTANAAIDHGSYDPDRDAITLSQLPSGSYPRGTTSVTLRATDSFGSTSECIATVTVVDKTPPAITNIKVNPAVLWPPNHKFVYVTINYINADNCDNAAAINCQLSVKSNEPVNGQGDGNTTPDWIIVDAHHVWLRAERSGKGSGRDYTITINCRDQSGNIAEACTTVKVAK